MNSRRNFLKTLAASGTAAVVWPGISCAANNTNNTINANNSSFADGASDRRYWVGTVKRLGGRVLDPISQHKLKKTIPCENNRRHGDRSRFSPLEAFARVLFGISPWLELEGLSGAEGALQSTLREQARAGLDAATDPQSPDYLFAPTKDESIRVYSAEIAVALMRAPTTLWRQLGKDVQKRVIVALQANRNIPPVWNNHVLFAAAIEAFLYDQGQPTKEEWLEGYIRQMLSWYAGDGFYKDGDFFHYDYYNSYVIHPYLVELFDLLRRHDSRLEDSYKNELVRARHYSSYLERMIAPDGSYPPTGRSLCYRFGVFHVLSQMALRHQLPEGVTPAQVRCGITAVMRRTLEAPGTFDADGWLQLGVAGHQPELAEWYTTTGSLYYCCSGLLALGLPPQDAFWSDPPAPWTSQRFWSGADMPYTHSLSDKKYEVNITTLPRNGAESIAAPHAAQ